ncbi:hypothetical protein AB0J83_11925 [Actinoplanes sp. NPDC049596]|uniref:hypothetical protein n=1 Tax=unclassified Actinoplanes TaxID=2626549 RepID=UPI003414AE62
MKTDKSDYPLIASIHPEGGTGGRPAGGITRGALVEPGLALLAAAPVDPSAPMRLVAGPPGPGSAALLDVPVVRTLQLRSPRGETYLAMEADLTDWSIAGEPPWSPAAGDPFDDDAAELAGQLLSRCRAPDEEWFGRDRAEPGPYPYVFSRPVDTMDSAQRRRKRPKWVELLAYAVGRAER